MKNNKEFTDDFIENLQSDLNILNQIKVLWQKINRDPKLLKFLSELSTNKILRQNVTTQKEEFTEETRRTQRTIGDFQNIFRVFPYALRQRLLTVGANNHSPLLMQEK